MPFSSPASITTIATPRHSSSSSSANRNSPKRRDLSYNNLTGKIPISDSLRDVSYNHFTWVDVSGPKTCSKGNNSLHINCGGEEVYISSIKFDEDTERKSTSSYYQVDDWAISNTGHFLELDPNVDHSILFNESNIHNNVTNAAMDDTVLYRTARTSAISVTYYGLCLVNGNYTVKLHFAEIILTQDNSSNIVGKRVFDVYLQGKLELKDFDIVKEAGGVYRTVVKSYTVIVRNNTLKIQFYWAGKGTTTIPYKGNYGPLISAISVDPTELMGMDLESGIFTLTQIKAATKNFDISNKLGEGGFGMGKLNNGTLIAIKQLSPKSTQGFSEFVTKLGVLCTAQHENIVRLYGFCAQGEQKFLVLEYMENNSLSHALFAQLKAKLAEGATDIAGTQKYMAPEYALHGHLTFKADVYSFGLVLLEIVSGKSVTDKPEVGDFHNMFEWACKIAEEDILELVDPDLGSQYSEEDATKFLKVALLCTLAPCSARPTIEQASKVLEDQTNFQDLKNLCLSVDTKNDIIRKHCFDSSSETSLRISELITESIEIELS
ncbi:hypothetical protein QVD17_16860 [Tagetes erecta]|uniref:non-specific serine/threonine protein kinase n=1 Tax=Tagetes erecta TaxID=13708 RepID=A0AAD8KUU9_TARER|nr:hypothetical protein QVD17_16860 [Tagetes erecta]